MRRAGELLSRKAARLHRIHLRGRRLKARNRQERHRGQPAAGARTHEARAVSQQQFSPAQKDSFRGPKNSAIQPIGRVESGVTIERHDPRAREIEISEVRRDGSIGADCVAQHFDRRRATRNHRVGIPVSQLRPRGNRSSFIGHRTGGGPCGQRTADPALESARRRGQGNDPEKSQPDEQHAGSFNYA